MNITKWVIVSVVILSAVLALVMPVGAQSPIDGAIATLAVATAQAQRWQEAQAATRQAMSIEATRQAQVALATRQAQSIEATATAESLSIEATRTAYTQEQSAIATRQAVDIEATRAAIAQAEIEQDRQERSAQATEVFLYLAFGLGLAGMAFIVWRVVLTLRAIEQRASRPADLQTTQPPQDDTQAIDGEFTERNRRGLDFEVITDPVSIAQFEAYVMEHGQ